MEANGNWVHPARSRGGLGRCRDPAVVRASACPAPRWRYRRIRVHRLPAQCGRLSARGTQHRVPRRLEVSVARGDGVRPARADRARASRRRRRLHALGEETGFNLVRVLAVADVLFKLPADEGLRHMPALFEMAARRGLYVEIVALADTARFGMTAPASRAGGRGREDRRGPRERRRAGRQRALSPDAIARAARPGCARASWGG